MAYTGKGGAVSDLVLLDNISEDGIVDCLGNHHSHREIYTYIGPVLISVNPYQTINGLYGDKKIKKFVLKKEYDNNPHVYAIAERAYRTMVNDLSNECVVITGESGSGKTEASKKVMEYIAAMNTSNSKSAEVKRVKNQLLKSNPLLESFGNAKTVRNDNSSRFGKYMEILFLVGDPAGGQITTYLLEKSRVVGQLQMERNFHIFYELLNDRSLCSRYGLQPSGGFNYISDPSASSVQSVDDVGNWSDTKSAMKYIGIEDQEQDAIMSLIAFLLHLGNVDFKGSKANITDFNSLQSAANLLQVSDKQLQMAVTHRTVKSGIEQIQTPLNENDARNARDSMAKSVYSKLFEYIVFRANEAIACDKYSTSIGVLDIYGFEILGVNGFEQLCINYTNEKLHQLFIQLTLKAEQEEYRREGIQWQEVRYYNNEHICKMIEAKRGSLFDLLNEESLFPKGNDSSLFNKMKGRLKKSEFVVPPRGSKNEFQILHYAGAVTYSANGFVETNKDKLYPDIVQCVTASQNPIAQQLFNGHELNRKSVKVFKRAPTTCTQYRDNVQLLMTDLSRCNQHYIRCIKPNEHKAASQFDFDLVKTQAKYLGLLENVKVRRAGYAFRMSYDRFASKYKCVLPDSQLQGYNPDAKAVTETILRAYVKGNRAYEFGRTKIFIKDAKSILGIEEKRKNFLETARNFLPPEESGLIFADKVLGVDEKFVKKNLTFCVGGQGFYWYSPDGAVAQFFPMEKIEYIGFNDVQGWMTIHTSYPSKVENETVHLTYLSENIYGANVTNFVEVMHSMGYNQIDARNAGNIPFDATDMNEYKNLVKNIAKGEKPTVQRGKAPQASGCQCVVS